MATVDLRDSSNQMTGSIELDANIFEAPVKPHLFHAEVRRQLSLRRAGSASTKNRHGVSGGGSKPYRQKGTGRARQGSIRSPQYKGGGSVFGPVPRSYEHQLPKKVRRAALCGALSLRQGEGAVVVLDSLALDEIKTRKIVELVRALGFEGSSVLLVLEGRDLNVERSTRNLAAVDAIRVDGLNVYDVLRHEKLVLTQGALARLTERLAGGGEARS